MKIEIKIILFLLLIAVVFSIGFTPIRICNDVWWHVKTGKYIVEHNYKLPENDIFAFTSANYKWDNHEWLTQILFYKVYNFFEDRQLGGFRSLLLLKSLILVLAFSLLCYLIYFRSGNYALAIFLAILAIFVSKKTIDVRPPIITYVFLTIYFISLYKFKLGKINWKYLILLPFLMILWANMHGGFILGLIVIFFFFIGEIFELIMRKYFCKCEIKFQEYKNILVYMFLGIATFLFSFATPYGYKLYVLTYRVMTEKALVKMIPELHPPLLRFTPHYLFLVIITLLSLLIIAVIYFLKRKSENSFKIKGLIFADLFILLFFLQQSMSHVRHLPLFALTVSPIAGAAINNIFDYFIKDRKKIWDALNYIIIICAIIIAAYGVFIRMDGESDSYINRNKMLFSGTDYIRENYPASVCDFILEKNIKGRMFNDINFAGYLIWRLSPEHTKVFTDARYDIFGADFIIDEAVIKNALEKDDDKYNWRKLFQKYKFDFVVIYRTSPLAKVLIKEKGWTLVYDWIDPRYGNQDGYCIFVKEGSQNEK